MDKVEIPQLKKKVARLALGAAPFGGVYGETKITDCGMTLRTAIDNGVTYIDTAPWYGQGERKQSNIRLRLNIGLRRVRGNAWAFLAAL